MTAPDNEGDEGIEDPEVDEQMDSGVRTTPQRHDEDETAGENPHDDGPDGLEDESE